MISNKVWNQEGVIREFKNLGLKNLPYRIKKHQLFFYEGK